MRLYSLLFLLAALLLNGCATTRSLHDPKAAFASGEKALVSGDYGAAVKTFESLDTDFPLNDFSQQAQRQLMYAYYMSGDKTSAAALANRYIHLYPRSNHVDYAYYMKAIANFSQNRGFLAEYFPMDLSLRDPGTSLESYRDFSILLHNFPNSAYAPDARQRMIYLRNMFAKKELHISEYFMDHKMYVAAINRANNVLRYYSQSPQTEKALAILVKGNRKLGLHKSEREALKILKLNYPHSKAL